MFSLSEKAHLLRNMFTFTGRKDSPQNSVESHEMPRSSREDCTPHESARHHGFAFSQEEHGVISQSQLIRSYNSTLDKPPG